MNNIKAKYTSYVIPNYNLGDNKYIEQLLSIWNKNYFKFDPIGYEYISDLKELRIPRGLDINYIEKSFGMNVEIDYKPDPYENASYRLMVEPRDDIQRKAISYLLGEGNFYYTKKYSQLTLNLDTGDGKTYCVIAGLTFMKTKSIIITHINKIKKQWYDSFLKMTDIDEQFICDIKGKKDIDKLLERDDWKYKVYLVNHSSLRSYGEKYGWEKITELFNRIKVGVKIIDEAHLEFNNMIKIDMYTNTKKTIYLTATFARSEFKENKLFNLCFKNIAKYGIETRNDKRKHIIYIGVLFNSNPTLNEQLSIKGRHGFDRNAYIDYELNKNIFFDVIKYIIDYFKDKEGKILILSSKIDSTKKIADYLKNIYKNKTVSIYNSTTPEDKKEKALTTDIISSTPKSAGTGLDNNGLRFEINTEPTSSEVLSNQIAGRLRAYGDKEYSFYIELVDTGFDKVYNMYKNRQRYFKKKCAKLLELKYDKKIN